MPAYNEEKIIARTVTELGKYFGDRAEIIVVAQGSDGTAEAAESAGVPGVSVLRFDGKLGKGRAVRFGLGKATGEFVAMADADLSSPPEEIDKLFSNLKEYDVAVGSRALPDSVLPIRPTPARVFFGRMFNLLVNMLFGLGVRDTQCGFKAFRGDAVRKILPSLTVDGWEFDVEMLYEAKRNGLTIKEVPVVWSAAPSSKVSVLSDSLKMFEGVVGLWLRKSRK